ncbi:hypothetical protein H3146_24780 [Streptomyces sp. OF3]|uniref:Uncharacterized protein n=1 Tax=Streptomyces alkaliterrae TaxID=2213162 RepID=A0A7W3ZQ15_9ACTN|nr:hypothetical protein [Streptomyces alkaliterrae]MBB1256539.1 hypothetical protein [Streptomyces alkaliterrae]
MPTTTTARRGHAMTSRDLEILQWIGRWRAVTCDQVAREFDRRAGSTRRREVYERRLRALHALGMLRQDRPLSDRPRIHWLTRAGMTAAGMDGAPASPSVAELVHDLEVIELAAHLARIQPDHQLITEQEIRRCEPNPSSGPGARLRSDIEIGAGRGTGGRAFPDLASVVTGPEGDEQVWVHELERARKGRARLMTIMLSYAYAEHVHGVVYWAWPDLVELLEGVAAEANRHAEEAGLRPCIVVRPWKPKL